MNHGDTTITTASTAPNPRPSQGPPLLYRRYHAHAPKTGATDITTGSVSPPIALIAPKPTHGHIEAESSRYKVSRNISVISSVVSVVAQIKSAEKKIA